MEKYIQRPGCRLAYEQWPGTRGICAILIHGYGIDRSVWQPQIGCLREQGYAVINVDVRGHGRSRPAAEFSVLLAAEDLRAVIEAEQPGPYLLCGLSMGAFAAQEYAFRFGGAAGYLLAGATPLFMPYPRWEKTLLAWSGAMMNCLYTWPALKRAMVGGSAETEPAQQELRRMFQQMNKREFLISWQGFTDCLHQEEFQFDAPLLALAGERDTRGTILKHLPDWQRLYVDCAVKLIPGAGHVVNLDQPQAFNSLLLSFLADCEQRLSAPS